MVIARHGQGADTSAVEGMLHGDNLMAAVAVTVIGIPFGNLQRSLDGLRTAVGKKYPVHAGHRQQFLRRVH